VVSLASQGFRRADFSWAKVLKAGFELVIPRVGLGKIELLGSWPYKWIPIRSSGGGHGLCMGGNVKHWDSGEQFEI
jgi:hypothetical protein